MKKYFKIIGISLALIGVIFLLMPTNYKCQYTKPLTTAGCINSCLGISSQSSCYGFDYSSSKNILQQKIDFWKSNEIQFFCEKEGEQVVGENKCCDGLQTMGRGCDENDCNCKFPPPGGIIKCSDCGNGICERKNLEDFCNCPQDCDILRGEQGTCGNGKCEQNNGEDKTLCVEDCFIDSGEVYSKDYYESFRKKCGNDKCCLSSVDSAESQNSPLFESRHKREDGILMKNAPCPDNSMPDMNKCVTSYIWCESKK